jgi:CRISPR-associated protein Csy3
MATKTADKTATLKTASVLAFERKLDPSDALLASVAWDDRQTKGATRPLMVREKSVRGTISNRLKATVGNDPAKLDADIQKPNLQTVDVAALPTEHDTLRASFTLRVLGGAGHPSACNDAAYQAKLLQTVKGYVQAVGFGELARRYAHNLANARFLWRNRVGAEQVEVQLEQLQSGQAVKTWAFDAMAVPLRSFDGMNEGLQGLADVIAAGLAGSSHTLLRVTAFARMGAGQEVFPSQELILDKEATKKSKTLYDVDGVAGLHSQKVGNALRTIDDWHCLAGELGPIAVEPYGSVTTLGKACRRPSEKDDFYSLLDKWLLKDEVPALNDQHFVMATLVRGGVFGEAGKD